MAYIEKRISFDHERDRDIINFLDSMTSNKSNKLIRNLLRDYIKDREKSRVERIEEKLDEALLILRKRQLSFTQSLDNSIDESRKIEVLEDNLMNIGV